MFCRQRRHAGGLLRRKHGVQIRAYSMPAVAETIAPTLGGTCSHQNGKMQDLLHKFQALCSHRDLQGAVDVLFQMDRHGQLPCEHNCLFLLKACGREKALMQAKQIQAYFELHGSKISTLLKESLIIVLVKCGACDDALHLFETLPDKTELSWTAIIAAFADSGKPQKAVEFYQRMEAEGIKPSKLTFVGLLKACGSLQDLKLGKDLHLKAKRAGFLSDIYVGSTLVSMYGKCGDILEAKNVFTNLKHRNAVSWNAMLSAHVDYGQPEKALECFNSMKKENVTPVQTTYSISLQACAMLGEEEEAAVVDGQTIKMEALKVGKALHDELKRRGFQSHPSVHFGLLNMYSKCGGIREAENVFWGLQHHDVISWTSFLTGFVVQGQGEKVLELYKEMQKEGTSPDEHTMVVLS